METSQSLVLQGPAWTKALVTVKKYLRCARLEKFYTTPMKTIPPVQNHALTAASDLGMSTWFPTERWCVGNISNPHPWYVNSLWRTGTQADFYLTYTRLESNEFLFSLWKTSVVSKKTFCKPSTSKVVIEIFFATTQVLVVQNDQKLLSMEQD